MATIYSESDLDKVDLKCSHCGWQGKGREAIIIDLYGIAKVQELHCPKCDHYLGGLKTTPDRSGPTDATSFQIS